MHSLRQIGSELARALVVLALVFLSFAHAPLAAAAPHGPTLTATLDMSFCGDVPAGDAKAHAPCHACRLGAGADLPAPTRTPLTLRTVAEIRYGALPVLSLPAEPLGTATARGPPIA